MRIKNRFALFILCLAISLSSTQAWADAGKASSGKELYIVKISGKYGFMDAGGKVVIQPIFLAADEFFEDLSRVKIKDKWGYINPKGEMVIDPVFSEAYNFSEGLALIVEQKKCGFIDKKGKVVIPPQFAGAMDFKEGLAGISKDGRCGYINREGKVVIAPQFDTIGFFAEGMAVVGLGDRYGYCDKGGKIVIKAEFDRACDFSEGLAAVNRGGKLAASGVFQGGKWGFINKSGKIVIDYLYDDVGSYKNGLAAVKSNNLWFFIDTKGKTFSSTGFEMLGQVSEGLAAAKIHNKCGFINPQGKFVISPQFDQVWPFRGGIAAVKNKNAQTWGYIDKDGHYVWEMEEAAKAEKVDFSAAAAGFTLKKPWRLEKGRLVSETSGGFNYNLYPKKVYSDCLISCKAKWLGGGKNSGYGLIFRVEDNGDCYTFLVSHEGNFALFKLENAAWQMLVPWQACSLLLENEDCELKVASAAENIWCFINNNLVVSYKETGGSKGYLWAGLDISESIKCSFDDFSIEELTPEKLSVIKKARLGRPIALSKAAGFLNQQYWTSKNGQLFFDGGQKDKSYAVICWDELQPDSSIKVKAFFLGGLNDWFGLIFRFQDDKNYYRFKIASDGFYGLDKVESGQFKKLKDEYRKGMVSNKTGNILSVVCRGDKIKCYLNDKLLFEVNDKFQAPEKGLVKVGLFSNGIVSCSFSEMSAEEN